MAKIMRVKTTFRTGVAAGGVYGGNQGELFPGDHPLVNAYPEHYETADAYLARRWPEHFEKKRRGLLGRGKKTVEADPPARPPADPPADPDGLQDTPELPERPPTSGPGSGVEAWRIYAAQVTDSPAESWADLSRDEIIELLDSEGASDGQE